MRRQDMPTCCAIDVLTEFGNTHTAINSTTFSKEEVAEFLDQQLNSYRNRSQAILQVNLNGEQYGKLGSVFLDKGFIEIASAIYNPGHGTSIYILIKVLHSKPI